MIWFAESGARNWVHSAVTVLAFLRKERELLRPGYTFQPLTRDAAIPSFEAEKAKPSPRAVAAVIQTSAPVTDVGVSPN